MNRLYLDEIRPTHHSRTKEGRLDCCQTVLKYCLCFLSLYFSPHTPLQAEDFVVQFSDGTLVQASALRDLLGTVKSLQEESVATLFLSFHFLLFFILFCA